MGCVNRTEIPLPLFCTLRVLYVYSTCTVLYVYSTCILRVFYLYSTCLSPFECADIVAPKILVVILVSQHVFAALVADAFMLGLGPMHEYREGPAVMGGTTEERTGGRGGRTGRADGGSRGRGNSRNNMFDHLISRCTPRDGFVMVGAYTWQRHPAVHGIRKGLIWV